MTIPGGRVLNHLNIDEPPRIWFFCLGQKSIKYIPCLAQHKGQNPRQSILTSLVLYTWSTNKLHLAYEINRDSDTLFRTNWGQKPYPFHEYPLPRMTIQKNKCPLVSTQVDAIFIIWSIFICLKYLSVKAKKDSWAALTIELSVWTKGFGWKWFNKKSRH